MDSLQGHRWHQLTHDQATEILETDLTEGLTKSEVETRRARFGANAIPHQSVTPLWKSLLLQFHQPLVYILLVAATTTLVFKDWVDAGVIYGVVLVNAIIGFLHEAKAARAVDSLRKSLEVLATVLRDGKWQQLSAHQIVPGDVIQLQSGDKVPADVRLVQVRGLQIDEAALTGESVPSEKGLQICEVDAPLADRHNMAWSGTLVTAGRATGVVIATGASTELGRISQLIASSQPLETPLTQRIASFSRILMYAIIAFAVVAFVVGLARGESAVATFKAAVALAVGAIPEGLPAAVTILLAIGMHRMSTRNAIIRKLPAVETLGSTTVICSDKTGTLTQNQMTVRKIFSGGKLYEVTGEGYQPHGSLTWDGKEVWGLLPDSLRQTLVAGMLCNDSRIVTKNDELVVEGDPTEAALLVSAAKGQLDPVDYALHHSRIDTLPFESEFQYMATLHAIDGQHVIYVKGAVERIVERCNHAASVARDSAWSPDAILEQAHHLAAQGLRVLAFARCTVPITTDQLTHDLLDNRLEFLGLQGMIDPPRPEAAKAIATCQQAGVLVKMITGDHALTARVIAEQLGIIRARTEQQQVLTGRQLEELDDQQLADTAQSVAVFARVTPEQKLRLVKGLQSHGHVVAMTGDGVNDAPALRQADIGIAMGITGTEVSKEAADMVLTDDNFATIEAAVEEGRGVFDNLTKFIVWTLPTNLGEGLVILVAVLAGVTIPILPTQILWINMTTAVLLGLMLAFEPKETHIMLRRPRDPAEPILTNALLRRIALVGCLLLVGSFALFEWAIAQGASDAFARTVAVNVFVFGEAFYLLNCRSLSRPYSQLSPWSNLWIWVGIGLTLLAQLAFTYLPVMNALFRSEPIGWLEWGAILLASFVVFVVVEFEKWLFRPAERTSLDRLTQPLRSQPAEE